MTPERYQRLKPLYDAALDMPMEKRAQFVAKACGNDDKLRAELEALLAANETGTGPLDAPFIDFRDFARKQAFSDGDVVLNRFRIVRFIDFGGMGEVYEVEDSFLRGVHVALKTILPNVAGDPDLRKRFEREVLLAREVAHSNLCPIYDIFHCEDPPPGYLFLTMKLLPGQTLAARLRLPPPMTTEEGLSLLRQTSLGLAAIHAAGIIHRDIKPNNIMVDGIGHGLRLWITDFGLARAFETESTVSSVGTVAGTPGYIAPELYLEHPPSQASDLFALGVVLHEVFTGQKPTPVPGTHSYTVSPRLAPPKVPALSVRLITEFLHDDPRRRCIAFADSLEIIDSKVDRSLYTGRTRQFWTRRRFAGAVAASVCVIAGGAWWKRDDVENVLEDIFEPLPLKRSVALMAWPLDESTAVVSTVLDSIGQRLARAEAYVKNLLIITHRDLPRGAASPTTPAESVSAMGANLVLAASLHTIASRYRLTLQVLDAGTQRVLRKAMVITPIAELSSIAQKASEKAAKLLSLPIQEAALKDTDELQRVSPEVFRIFSEAEQLASEPNDSGLEMAILKYQQALDIDPHFALGYARLAMAYTEQYLSDNESATLKLAQSNAALAIRYNPGSAKGLLSQAMVLLYSGKIDDALAYFAKSLKADPGNPETLFYKAQALRNSSRWPEAEQVYRDTIAERPNYWPAYNELGWILSRQAKYGDAADAFDAAATAAPKVAMPLANLAVMYMEQGKRAEAEDACARSLKRCPNEGAYLTLGDIAFSDGNYQKSLDNYILASKFAPKTDFIYRNIGDCYTMLGQMSKARESYARAATLLSDDVARNPRNGANWATLAFYHAKIGDATRANSDLKNVEAHGANDVESQFFVVQALALLGKKDDALKLLLSCMDKGLSTFEVDMAPDLKEIRRDPRYLSHLAKLPAQSILTGT